jgi:rhodanese-related sulfurtransferase
MVREISVVDAHDLLKSGAAVLVDVRTAPEFGEIRADGAISLPLDQLSKERLTSVAGEKQVVFICKSGARGRDAAGKAEGWGIPCANVVGGTSAWEAAESPVIRGASTVISIERQVRIVAGGLVVLGTVAGLLGSPLAFVVPLGVGSGLVFAGVTDTCGLAMVLGRMPWNRRCC